MTQHSEIEQCDRDAAADIWRDYVAKIGECMVERQMRSGEMDEFSSLIHTVARHRIAAHNAAIEAAAAEVEAWFPGASIDNPKHAAGKALRDAILTLRKEAP